MREKVGPAMTSTETAFVEAIRSQMAEAWQTAEDHGFHEDRTFGESIALMHSELSEALEEFRDSADPSHTYYAYPKEHGHTGPIRVPPSFLTDNGGSIDPYAGVVKPEGVGAEFADVIIRILDTAQMFGIPLGELVLQKMAYNKTRPHKHGRAAL